MHLSPRFKQSAGIALLFAMAALTPPAFAQLPQMPPGFGEQQDMPDTAGKAKVDDACIAVRDWMKKPGLAGLLKGLPYNPDYDPGTVAENLQNACGLTEDDLATMPDVSTIPVDDLVKDKVQLCTTMGRLLGNGAIGISGAFAGGTDAGLIEGEEIFHQACQTSPYEAEAMERINTAEFIVTPDITPP